MIKFLLALLLFPIVSNGAFYRTQIEDLKIEGNIEGLKEELLDRSWRRGGVLQSNYPISRFERFSMVVSSLLREEMRREDIEVGAAWVVIEMDEPEEMKGYVDYWTREGEAWGTMECRTDPSKLVKCSDEEVEIVRARFARQQLSVKSRGGMWYRSQIEGTVVNRRGRDFDQTFSTLSGGRALAENLALDRELILGADKEDEEVPLASIKGVTVKPIPWKERLPEGDIVVDALAMRVPEDQYFMVVPSLQKLFGLMDRIEETGTPMLQSFSVGDQYRELPTRYRRQMGLDLPDVMAGFLPVKHVAVTGGDPFFPTGSDVAVIFETDKVDSVFSLLRTAISAKAKGAGAGSVGGEGVLG
ncbi:hypothetical protein N9A94_08095, partial [Akkermansiaceae bacterium]|nr:hypothetical protein [Akkermansiaceae bacterium]